MPLCGNMELLVVLKGMEDILVLGVWPPSTLFGKLGEVPELVVEPPRLWSGG